MFPRIITAVLASSLALTVTATARGGTLLSFDFNGPNPWAGASTDVMPSTPLPIDTTVEAKAVGTIDKAGSAEPSGGLLLTADIGAATGEWHATFTSGLLPVKNTEVSLGKLTLAFDLSVSVARPVVMRVASFDAQRRSTGTLEKTVYPAAADFYQRNAIDLSSMKAAGGKAFSPTDPFIQIVFEISGPAWPSDAKHLLRVDNVNYASPALYVSPTGDDKNDGRTEAKPMATPQKAVDAARPGDIVLLMNGEYRRPAGNGNENGIVQFEGAGTPAAWIVLKNYPGHTPVLFVDDSWNAVRIGGAPRNPAAEVVVSYFEVRGLHVLGSARTVKQDHAADIGQSKPTTNSNAITVDPRKRTTQIHHIRMADNVVKWCTGGGICGLGGDWLTIENNDIQNNCWFMIYAGSGISLLTPTNFDATQNVPKMLISRNYVGGNRCYMPWAKIGKFSDGNGIIIDCNNETPEASYFGRTLIQNNVSFNNGGSGIHTFKSHRVDIANNTVYLNAATPEQAWGQLFVQRGSDIRIVNNIAVARPGQPVNTVNADTTDRGNKNIVRANNVYIGGKAKPIMGDRDVVADPLFVNGSIDAGAAAFWVKHGSPAIGHGAWSPVVPLTDITGRPRPLDRAPDAGAYQQ